MKQISPSTFPLARTGPGRGRFQGCRVEGREENAPTPISLTPMPSTSGVQSRVCCPPPFPELRCTPRCMPLQLRRDCFRILHALIFYLQIFKERKGQYRALIAFSDAHSNLGTQHPWCLYIKDLLVFLQGERRELLSGYTI